MLSKTKLNFTKTTTEMRFETKEVNGNYKVWDNKAKVFITHECPKNVALEICEDFNKMDNKDYSPLLKSQK